jgi:iron complex outermembrane recepter protein
MPLLTRWSRFASLVLLLALPAVPCLAQNSNPPDLTQASLEDLMNMQVTSVSKKGQSLSKAGAAIFVITQEDIRRSGASNIPDLLRMVPGVNVARINSSTWAIGIRGFSDLYADKVLVLIDGRSVYSPISSGVDWDQQDVPLEDIERIEVIRGPGGTVWGANAVNGVINIITKSAKKTLGGLVSAGGGSETDAEGLAQYGGAIGANGTYRIFGKYFDVEPSTLPGGGSAEDGWHSSHGGFRSDWDLDSRDTLTVQGDLQESEEGQNLTTVISSALPEQETFTERFDASAGNILGRWNHTLKNGSETSLQIYDDYSSRVNNGGLIRQNTVDLDFQDHMALGSRQDIVWGLDARVADLHMGPGYSIVFLPPARTDLLLSTFFQDEVKIASALSLTIGSKFEHNDYTGLEFEPSAQLVWNPTARQSLWLSAARAIRQPNVVDVSIQNAAATFPTGNGSFGVVTILGNPIAKVERLNDFEAGYRVQAAERLSVDVAAFLSYYHALRTVEEQEPYFVTSPGPPHMEVPAVFENIGNARTYGGELSVNWNPTNRWRISPGYSWIHMVFSKDAANVDTQPGDSAGGTPQQQVQARSELNLPRHFEWDSSLAYVGRLTLGVPAYTRVDTRLGWRMSEHFDFSITGQNLLSPRHAEFPSELGVNYTLVSRSVFAKVTWKF